MQGDWDRRERSASLSFRRAEAKNRQRAGPRGGAGSGASPTSPYISHSIYAYFRAHVYVLRVGLGAMLVSCDDVAMPFPSLTLAR